MSRRRLLQLIPYMGAGGAQKVMHDFSLAFGEHYDVTEAVFSLGDGHVYRSGKPVIDLGIGSAPNAAAKARAFARRIARTRETKRSRGIDLSVSHLEGAHYVNVLSRSNDRTILVVHGSLVHDSTLGRFKGFAIRRLLVPLLHNRADRVVTVSRDLAAEMRSLGVRPDKVLTINNFFDVDGIITKSREELAPKEQALFDGPPVLVTAGRLAPQKNHAALLDLFATVRAKTRAKLAIVGDGELRSPLVERAHALGLQTYEAWSGEEPPPDRDVYFLGHRANPYPYIGAGTLFVLPSLFEGFPLALCEAMACGVPVVAADCATGPREILAPSSAIPEQPIGHAETGDFGMLMPLLKAGEGYASAVDVWSDTVAGLLDDPAERSPLAAAGRRRVEDFTAAKIVPQWLALFEEVLAPAGR